MGIEKKRIWGAVCCAVVGTNCAENLHVGHLLVGEFWVGRNPFCLIERKKLDIRV